MGKDQWVGATDFRLTILCDWHVKTLVSAAEHQTKFCKRHRIILLNFSVIYFCYVFLLISYLRIVVVDRAGPTLVEK
jgi:hypothetical protein